MTYPDQRRERGRRRSAASVSYAFIEITHCNVYILKIGQRWQFRYSAMTPKWNCLRGWGFCAWRGMVSNVSMVDGLDCWGCCGRFQHHRVVVTVELFVYMKIVCVRV